MLLFNNQPIIIKQFPNGESLLDKPFFGKYKQEKNVVTLKYESDADLFHLLLVRKSLWFPCDLHIPYFPYSRMDRNSQEYIFTLKTVCKFINWMEWQSVTIYEPHSDVTPALLNHCKIVSLIPKLLALTDFDKEKDFVLYPDAGAQKKYAELVGANNELIGLKKRDFKTGRISNLQITGGDYSINARETWALSDKRIFIIDDLCSKGGTFILAVNELMQMGAEEFFLIVGHCEDTIFKGEILTNKFIKKVYTTNSLLTKSDPKIQVLDILAI